MITIKNVAEKSGYSIATVSRVINNNRPVDPAIKARVTEVIKELNYVPNAAARTLVKRCTDAIGVVVNNLHSPFFHDLILGFEAGAAECEFNVVFCSAMGREAQQKQRYVRYLSNGVVDGLILYGSYKFDEDMVRELHKSGYPLILIESVVEGVDTNYFLIDNYQGVSGAVKYLHEKGHKKIAYIAGKQDKKVAVDRLEGYKDAMNGLGLPVRDGWLQIISENSDECECVKVLLNMPKVPTAVLCYDDVVAAQVISYATEIGLKVPKHLSVMGFDNQRILPDGYMGPLITSVSQPLYEIGFDSIFLLSQILKGQIKGRFVKNYATAIAEKDTVAVIYGT